MLVLAKMGIQIFKQLVTQRTYVLGELRRLERRAERQEKIEQCQALLHAIDLVIAHQGVNATYDREKAMEWRPKRQYFPKGAYRRDVLNILRRSGEPMRIAEILNHLCEMHCVELSEQQRSHAKIKLAQGNDVLVRKGYVVRASKAGEHRSAACTYALSPSS